MSPARGRGGVYAILGADSFLAEEALERLLADFVGDDRAEAVQVFRGDETGWARVLDAARARSLFSSRRAVIVRGAEALKGAEEDLPGYLEDPNPEVALVLLAAKPDKRRAAWKRIVEKGTLLPAEPLKGQRLRGRVREELRVRGLSLAPEAVEELLERVGQDLRRLMGELDKLEAFGRGSESLSAEAVASVLGRGLSQPFYKLSDAVAARDAARALELVGAFLEDGEEAIVILGTAHRSLRQLRAIKALQSKRSSREEKIAALGLPRNMEFKLEGLEQASRRWSERDLEGAVAALGRADRALKRGADAAVVLTAAVFEACGKAGEGSTSARRRGR